MAVDDDGLLPPWVIYHELVHAASRCMLRKVCAVEAEWVAPALLKLRDMHMHRLARSGRPAEASGSVPGNPDSNPGAPSAALHSPLHHEAPRHKGAKCPHAEVG